VSIVSARPRRSPHPYAPWGADMTLDRRGFRSVSVAMAGRHRPTRTNGRAPDPKAEGALCSLHYRLWALIRANAVVGDLSTVLTVGLTGHVIATIGGESGGWIISTMMRSWPLMRPAARSVR
jgi:hypothetical protein